MDPLTTTLVRNAVDTATLFSAPDGKNSAPDSAQLRFRVRNRWRSGTDGRATIGDYFDAEPDQPETAANQADPLSPAEYVVHALASTLTSGIVNIAATRGVALAEVTSTVEGNIDLDGVLGFEPQAGNGFERLHVRFEVSGDATQQQLQHIVQQAQARPALFDVITRGAAVAVVVDPT